MNRFSNYLVRSNLFVSFAAVSHYLYYGFKDKENFSLLSTIVIFSATYFGYHILRLNAWKFHKKNIGHENIYFYYRNKFSLSLMALILFVSTSLSLSSLESFQWIMIGVSFCIYFFYEGPIKRLQLRRLFIKPFVIGLVWSTFILGILEIKSLWTYFNSFLFISVLCIAFDLRDYQDDSNEDLKSIAEFEPFRKSSNLIYVYAIYAIVQGIYSQELFYPISIIIVYLGLKYFHHRFILFNLIFDGLIILRFLFYLLQN